MKDLLDLEIGATLTRTSMAIVLPLALVVGGECFLLHSWSMAALTPLSRSPGLLGFDIPPCCYVRRIQVLGVWGGGT